MLSVITNNANIGLGRRAELGSPGLNGNDCKVNSVSKGNPSDDRSVFTRKLRGHKQF